MKIVSLDPGGTTGVCIAEDATLIKQDQLTPSHHLRLWNLLMHERPDTIIYERFMYQRREVDKGVSLNLEAVEYIGILKLYQHAHSNTCSRLIEQTPAQAKNFWTDSKLKTISLWKPNAPHAMDATRHWLYFLMVNGEDHYVKMLRPT